LFSQAVQNAIKISQKKFDQLLGAGERDKTINGFWAESGHLGTHTDKFFTELGEATKGVKTPAQMEKAMEIMKERIQKGEFLD
jgi:hypothetical protein